MAWIGGSIFYVVALIPAARAQAGLRGALAAVDSRFRDLVHVSILTLLVTGAIVTFDRLQLGPGPGYAIALGIKIALAVWMFLLAQDVASRSRRRLIERRLGGRAKVAARRGSPTWLILALGGAILLLSDVLKVIGPAG